MKFWLSILSSVVYICLFSGCDFFKPKGIESVKSAETPSPSTPTVEVKAVPVNTDCDFLGFSKTSSKIQWKMANGQEIILCEHFDANKISDSEFKGWFNLYKILPAGPKAVLDDVNGTVPSEGYYIDVVKESDSKIVIKRILYVEAELGEDDLVLTTNELNCTKPDCEMTETKCGSGAIPYKKESISIVQKVVDKKVKAADIGDYEFVIADVIRAAVAGNKSAQRLMLDTAKEKLQVDGATAESYSIGAYQLKTLKSLGCLK